MKINIISDIHATIDRDGNVIYNLPFKYADEKYINAIDVLAEFIKNNKGLFEK